MLIGITIRFQNSYFSGAIPQVACALARALASNKDNDVELVYPAGETDWFIDNKEYCKHLPSRVPYNSNKKYDVLIMIVWHIGIDERTKHDNVIHFAHYPPIFGDMESCVYPWNNQPRSFKNIHRIWTYDFYTKHDIEYFEMLSEVPVQQIPYIWDSKALDTFINEHQIPEWNQSAKRNESMIPKDIPQSMSWCLRIFESNFSNSSHCIIPLNIVSEIRKTVEPVRFTVHNSETTSNNDFFKTNVVKNLILPDFEHCMLPRIRLPEVRREKTLIISHQRWRPMKNFLLDALYLGIPTIHNNSLIKNLGAPYYYELNQIRDAVSAYKRLSYDYKNDTGFFSPKAAEVRQSLLRDKFGPSSVGNTIQSILNNNPLLCRSLPVPVRTKPQPQSELLIAFATMWENFVPEHNFFTYLLKWVGSKNNINVTVNQENPNVVFWGPMSQGTEDKWPGIPKIFYTGENVRPVRIKNTFLNIGFDYDTSKDYIRLPLWILEINWFGGNVDKMINPRPVSIQAATSVPNISKERKFCAFVASNPNNPVRNATFEALHKWRHVDSGGRLFCNLPNGNIPSGLGGGGGELSKVEFYKNYKYVLAMENSAHEGYVTEKMFHAKVAGAVPIYWGDRWADRDFDSEGFVNMCNMKNPDELIRKLESIDDAQWLKMASIPAVTPFKKLWCEKTMEYVARRIFDYVTEKTIVIDSWENADQFADTLTIKKLKNKRIFVTATNMKFAESAVNAVRSFRRSDLDTKVIVYVWPDVTNVIRNLLLKHGVDDVREFPMSYKPWADFWEPQHYAWKLWIHKTILDEVSEGTHYLYVDSGVVFVREPTELWNSIDKNGIAVVNDPGQQNKRWCHPEFCRILNVTENELNKTQILAGIIGFRAGAYNTLINEAFRIATEHREAIVGNKWIPYGPVCMGHRHDQSILSILTIRYHVPRVQLNDIYCDTSARAAEQFNIPLYVHRGQYKEFVPFMPGIDEMYLINLIRRKDRLDSWKSHHSELKDHTYVLPAVDGRSLELNSQLIHCFRNNDFNWKKSVMGCALSHLQLWEKLANDNHANSYLIMEDDVRFSNGWTNLWKSIVNFLPSDADVIYLGGVLPPNKSMLPHVTESINQYFARVKVNDLFGSMRRYFHFCNYSYVLRKSGAQKLVQLVKERGIFTSGDHMIVNHGDSLLNIYFTTPLLSTCFQEDDPVYQKSEFNNFSRIDNFDSDLWNNTDCFTQNEISQAMTNIENIKPTVRLSEENNNIEIWNNFLRAIALKLTNEIPQLLTKIFEIWSHMSIEEFTKNYGWFRIFEQFIVTKNSVLMEHIELVYTHIQKCPHKQIFKEILDEKTARQPSIANHQLPDIEVQIIFFLPMLKPDFLEQDWLAHIFNKPIVWEALTNVSQLLKSNNPTLLYQIQRDKVEMMNQLYASITKDIAASNISVTLLHLSDEFGIDNTDIYSGYKRVIRNYVRPNLPSNVYLLPLGYTNGRSNKGYSLPPEMNERNILWSFVGSMDRPGRSEALEILKQTGNYILKTKESWDKPFVLNGPEYIELLRRSQFVPCFGGSKALESYRLYEALEHGSIPFYVTNNDEYEILFKERPFLRFESWKQAATILPQLAKNVTVMENRRRACYNWWEETKISITKILTNSNNNPLK
jgi:GR25 family glycosyltransferase involved in LPS biosynthesis